MSIDSERRHTGEASIPRQANYADLHAEATGSRRAAERDPSLADYEGAATRIKKAADYYHTQGIKPNEALGYLRDIYCDDEDNQTQRSFNALMINTMPALQAQRRIDQLATRSDWGRDEHAMRAKLVEFQCNYQHALRDVLAADRSNLDRPTISGLIALMGDNTPPALEFARASVNGAMSELLVMDALLADPSVTFAHFTDIEEDLRGTDIKYCQNGTWVGVDVKARAGVIKPTLRDNKPHLEVHVNPDRLDGWVSNAEALKTLQHEMREGLKYAKAA